MFIEGLVPMDALPGDRYQYHENTRKVIGERSRRTFSIGDKVRVHLDRVDAVEKKLNFSLVDREPQHSAKKKKEASIERGLARRFAFSSGDESIDIDRDVAE